MGRNSIWKFAISLAGYLVLLLVLIEAIWGVTAGLFIGTKMGIDKGTQEEISRILHDKGIKETDLPKSKYSEENWYKHLPPDVQKEVEQLARQKLQHIDWFTIALIVSAFAYGIVGFLFGLINKGFLSVGILVILSIFLNNPTVRFEQAKHLSLLQKSIVIVLAQFGICYLCGFLGALLGKRRSNR